MYDDILGPPPEKKEPKVKINLKDGESVSGKEEEIELDLEDLELDLEYNSTDDADPSSTIDEDDLWDLGGLCDDEDCDECDSGEGC